MNSLCFFCNFASKTEIMHIFLSEKIWDFDLAAALCAGLSAAKTGTERGVRHRGESSVYI